MKKKKIQNVEINSNEYFSYDVFSGMKSSNDIVDHVEWKHHCAITKEVQIPIIYDLLWFIDWSSM